MEEAASKPPNNKKKSVIEHYYRKTEPSHSLLPTILEELRNTGQADEADKIAFVETESCFNVEIVAETDDDDAKPGLTEQERQTLEWLLAETFEPDQLKLEQSLLQSSSSSSSSSSKTSLLLEFGPRMTFTSAFSSNATTICSFCKLTKIRRLELSRRYQFHLKQQQQQQQQQQQTTSLLSDQAIATLKYLLHDRMTEQEYTQPLTSLDSGATSQPVRTIPILEQGRAALEAINDEMGLGFDDFDLDYYTTVFKEKLGRNPTDVECFDMGQSNSEHSRHWFFGGKMVINGVEKPHTLFQMVKATIANQKHNSVIAFHDNSSAIRGYDTVTTLTRSHVDQASNMALASKTTLHPILTAETHNFPSGVAPFAGAETGTGGRLRDVMATGRGAHPIAGICAYCVGNLHIPGYPMEWEEAPSPSNVYPSNLAAPLQIEVQASDGASDYGNKYGEPVIHGFTRSFGLRLPPADGAEKGERYEWVKPIMFSAGVGHVDGGHVTKGEPEPGMLVVKVGGPAYRIGIGGGAASSRVVTSEATAALDFDAVQRGDAEMENRLNRLMRACCEMGPNNPIVSVHDQGAGGNGNVLKEIVEPAGATYDIRQVYVGDETLSVLEIWGAEYQENNALLIAPDKRDVLEAISRRENCPVRILGEVTGTGRVVVKDSAAPADTLPAVDLPLELVLGKMPQKTFVDNDDANKTISLPPFTLPDGTTVRMALDRVLRLLSVGSKRFLVNKVDRSVTGLVAQQQCVGPLQLPLANVGVVAHSHFGTTGTAVACGEQPIKGLISAAAMARMTVAECLTNLMWARISAINDIKASGNWMYAAKLPGEGAKMYEACEALRDALLEVGMAIDGGKDSLSMAAKCGDEVVKAPGELTLTAYVTCPDITRTVTPDLKNPADDNDDGGSRLVWIDLAPQQEKARLGGSALAQVYKQLGNESPDMDKGFAQLVACIKVTQQFMADEQNTVILAGHDRSDGGLIVTLLEMSFAGNCGISVTLPQSSNNTAMELLFAEEAGIVLEVSASMVAKVIEAYDQVGVTAIEIGSVTTEQHIRIAVGEELFVDENMTALRDVWEATSFELEKRQRNPHCVVQEQESLKHRKAPDWKLGYQPTPTPASIMEQPTSSKHKVAILRQEGSNGDREMLAAFVSAGFDAWDVTVSDLLREDGGGVALDQFRGLVFVGGFSFADVLDSAKGWAGVIKYNERVLQQFQAFKARKDTFSLGVCNGCQLMALLGWVPSMASSSHEVLEASKQPRLLHNDSGKFESRFCSVQIQSSPAVLLQGMEGSSLGVWVAHGEGRFYFPDSAIQDAVLEKNLAPIRYVNDENEITQDYPFNPNGSPSGMAALCSEDGRHLALMPHPERAFTTWQWPWMPNSWTTSTSTATPVKAGPWLRMFQNARDFCDQAAV